MQAAVYDNWVYVVTDQICIGNLDSESNVGMVKLGSTLLGEAQSVHSTFRKDPTTKNLRITPFLTERRQFCIPCTNQYQLWTEFQEIKQTHNGRSRPIQQVANQLNHIQILLLKIGDQLCYHQLLQAMYAPLLAALQSFRNDSM